MASKGSRERTRAEIINDVLQRSGITDGVASTQPVQSLWKGYGQILRVRLATAEPPEITNTVDGTTGPRTVIVKHIAPPIHGPEVGSVSHRRKVRSYQVERAFYESFAAQLDPPLCRVPRLVGVEDLGAAALCLVLEDLDACGFAGRRDNAEFDGEGVKPMLAWLAHFHRTFMRSGPTHQGSPHNGGSGSGSVSGSGSGSGSGSASLPPPSQSELQSEDSLIWEEGCYWNLAVRPDEYAAMSNQDPLKTHAVALDRALNACPFKTVLHGDAKVANFCFSVDDKSSTPVAAVDFQYAGFGVGIRDVVYLLGSALDEDGLVEHEEALIDYYFELLALPDVEAAWRPLYSVAVADFERFLAGWSPGHWKRNGHSKHHSDLGVAYVTGDGSGCEEVGAEQGNGTKRNRNGGRRGRSGGRRGR